MIKKQDGLINWSESAASIERLVRGLNPWPSAFTKLGGKTLKIWRAEVCEDGREMPASDGGTDNQKTCLPGMVCRVEKDSFSVLTGEGTLRILELQAEGKRRMAAGEFLRGSAVEAGMRLG